MYMKLRSTVLTEEYLQELIEQLYGTLEYNRVLERENVTWDKAIGREQTEFVKAFVERRLQWMDSYYRRIMIDGTGHGAGKKISTFEATWPLLRKVFLLPACWFIRTSSD